MRAREPDETGTVERDGVRVGYEVFGSGRPTIVLLTSWAIVHMRQWKAQVPYLARHFRVITVEGRGNGRADRPGTAPAYADREYVDDAIAVMDATDTDRAVVAGLSLGGRHALQLAAWYPERAAGVVAIGAALPWPLPPDFDRPRADYQGAQKVNRHYWRKDYRGWVEFFMSQVFTEPHSTKQWEDGVGWGLDTDAETLLLTTAAVDTPTERDAEEICRAIRCPALLLHGDCDAVVPYETGVALAGWTGRLVTVRGGGHAPTMRDPVRTNLLIREFAGSLGERMPHAALPPLTWTRARERRPRALYVSSPIGLGHVRRDLAIADRLRRHHPDLQIDWLAQDPVTRMLAERGERIHPASRWLAGESAHFESEAGEHDLHVFQAVRRMDEIMVANFHVFHDVVTEEAYDLWVADEGWEIDHFLFDNPELKRTAYAWLSDFVGFLPLPDGGTAEAALTADVNAERVERIRRYPRLRDRSIFVGNPGDLVHDLLGPGLPTVRDFALERYSFAGYVTGFDPPGDRDQLRAELGYRPEERVCLVTAGGSGVGGHLLRKVAASFPFAAKRVPGLRMVAVTGPRIDPASVPVPEGVEVRGYVPDLYRHLAACDLAVVQGGLTTTMELVAARRPFCYFPLAHHFEQQVHVPRRLAQYGAGRRMEYADTDPEQLAEVIAAEIEREVDYRPVETDGAERAAALLAELL
ncbi:alpha/beta fold hydrolase [Pseudonocardia bannensis]|uniref:Alpha/beta fold hydrolase n=1 Tax=Pseudonocardia bannensis TaxID=630973 RepID=A0A848DFG9_9PSEU|nr:alpha/beta hydrolase [Pseudonocardia bannensis]NMH91304.1 alpha/beta fold hydrolase [Pseudonocardia bannensis]